MKQDKNGYCDVYVVRHGETDWNVLGKIQGHTDIPLNSKGISQAQQLREKLQEMDFAAAFSSNLSRARTTAEIILQKRNLPISEFHDLRERSFESWEGKLFKDFDSWSVSQTPAGGFASFDQYMNYKVHPGIESIGETYKRVLNCLSSQILPYFGSRVLAVTHGGVMRAILDHHMEWPPAQKRSITNCAVVVMRFVPDGIISLVHHEGIVSQ